MPCATYTDGNLQNVFFESYASKVEISNLFLFNFKQVLIHSAVNFPGSRHNSQMAVASALLCNQLSDAKTTVGYAILGDSAFASRANVVHTKIFRGRKPQECRDAQCVTSSNMCSSGCDSIEGYPERATERRMGCVGYKGSIWSLPSTTFRGRCAALQAAAGLFTSVESASKDDWAQPDQDRV